MEGILRFGSVNPTPWEYILTYGSVFVVMAVVVALAYWGIAAEGAE